MHKGKHHRVIRTKTNQDDNLTSLASRPNNASSQILSLVKEERHSKPENRKSSSTTPTPIDFDKFLPWVCREWGVPHIVIVIRANQEENLKLEIEKVLSKRLEEIKEEAEKRNDSQNRDSATFDFQHPPSFESEIKKIVIIEAHYDAQDQLEQVSFEQCRVGIPRKVIRAVNLCLPFHSKLTRLNICKGGLTPSALNEITKMLPHSNITIISFDNSSVPQGRYYTLFQETSQLSYLSLNRCRINDDICKEIAMNLANGRPGTNSLKILELASNDITDVGAKFLGEMLRTNRRLLHLNLAGNKITDVGGVALITSLMEFDLTNNEVLEMKKRRYKYSQKKYSCLRKSLDSDLAVLYEDTSNISVHSGSKLKLLENRTRTVSSQVHADKFSPTTGVYEYTIDPYTPSNLVLRNGCYFAKGNFILCSLNLAYNDLHYPFLKKVDEVVAYQQSIVNPSTATGLMRIVMDGNAMPVSCPELDRISSYLKSNIDRKQPIPTEKKQQSSTKSIAKLRLSKVKLG